MVTYHLKVFMHQDSMKAHSHSCKCRKIIVSVQKHNAFAQLYDLPVLLPHHPDPPGDGGHLSRVRTLTRRALTSRGGGLISRALNSHHRRGRECFDVRRRPFNHFCLGPTEAGLGTSGLGTKNILFKFFMQIHHQNLEKRCLG